MPKIDRAHRNYSYTQNLRGNAFKEDILWHFDFSTKQYDLYWPPCYMPSNIAAKTTFCLHLESYAQMWCKRYHIIFPTDTYSF